MHSSHDLYPILKYIQKHFYADTLSTFHRDRRQLLRALTWPAAWLDRQALVITPEDYNKLLLKKLRQIQKHGNPSHYRPVQSGAEGAYFPKYLMKALQDHCRHHREAIYLKLKHAGYTIDQIATDIAKTKHAEHTNVLAQAHDLIGQNRHKQADQNTTDQMTLGL